MLDKLRNVIIYILISPLIVLGLIFLLLSEISYRIKLFFVPKQKFILPDDLKKLYVPDEEE